MCIYNKNVFWSKLASIRKQQINFQDKVRFICFAGKKYG